MWMLFSLGDEFVKKLNNYQPLTLTSVIDDPWLVTSVEDNKIFQSVEGYSSYAYPEVGDILITYEVVMPRDGYFGRETKWFYFELL